MLAVILFDGTEDSILWKYQFLFLNFQIEKQITLLGWKKDMNIEDILKEVELRTAECHEWKLIVYGGDLSVREWGKIHIIDHIFKYFSDRGKSGKVEGYLPVSAWYVGYDKKRVRMYAGSDNLQKVDERRVYGSTYRMIWFDLDDSCGMQREYDLFRLICGMLALAINDIPGNFLECGYLYQLDVSIDRDDLAKYVVQFRERLGQIKDKTYIAYRKLEEDYRKRSKYPEPQLRRSDFTKNRQKLDGNMKWENINKDDLADERSMDDKLKRNRKWIRTRLYFPKGVLKEELGRMQENVDSQPGAEYLLNDAAKDRLEREMQETLDGMKVQRKKQERQRNLVKKVNVLEKQLMEEKERWQWGKEKYWVFLVLSLVQMVLLGTFWYKKNAAAIEMSAGYLKVLLTAWKCLIIAGLCYIVLIGIFWLVNCLEFCVLKKRYGELLTEKIEHSQKDRIQYMEEIVDLIARYQYSIRLKKEDCDRMKFLERRKEVLRRHNSIRENGEDMCRQLELLLGEDERIMPSAASDVSIDFTEEPKEVEYYWVPHRRNSNMTELNQSGYQINVFFDFISGIILKKTPEEYKGKQW